MTGPLTRDGAAHAAHSELSKHIYQQARPSITQQIISAVWRWLVNAYHRIIDATPGGAVGLLVIIALLAVVALFFTRRGVSGKRRGGGASGLDLPADVSSDQLRAEADAFAGARGMGGGGSGAAARGGACPRGARGPRPAAGTDRRRGRRRGRQRASGMARPAVEGSADVRGDLVRPPPRHRR